MLHGHAVHSSTRGIQGNCNHHEEIVLLQSSCKMIVLKRVAQDAFGARARALAGSEYRAGDHLAHTQAQMLGVVKLQPKLMFVSCPQDPLLA